MAEFPDQGQTEPWGPQLKEYVDEAITGPKGDKGDKGDTGNTGLQGVKGDTGNTGLQGIQGVKGDTGNAGADSTVEGPQGIQGVKGDQGIQGIQGVKGDTGTTGAAAGSIAGVLANDTVATTEIPIATFDLPANYLAAGAVLKGIVLGQVSSTATLTYRVRIGTAGTVADALVLTFITMTGAANAHTRLEPILYVITAGAAGTISGGGNGQVVAVQTGPATAAFAAATVNTTVALKVTVTLVQSTAQTHTTRAGVLSKVA